MKVAVTSSGDNLDAQMDPRFGRCAYFVIVDTDSMDFEVVENPGPQMGSGAGTAASQIVGDSGAEAVVSGNYGPNAAMALGAGGILTFQGSAMTVREAAEAAASGQLPEVGGATTAAHTGTMGQGGRGAAPGMPQGGGMGGGMGGGRGMGGGGGMGQGGGMGGGQGMGQGRGMGGGQGMGQGMGQPQQGYGQFGPQAGPMDPMMGGMGMPGPWGPQMPGPWGPQMGPDPEQVRQYHLSMLQAQAEMLAQQLDFIQSQIEYLESLGE